MTKNGRRKTPRDLLTQRMLTLERGQKDVVARLDALVIGQEHLTTAVVDALRDMRQEFNDGLRRILVGLERLEGAIDRAHVREQLGALESRVSALESERS